MVLKLLTEYCSRFWRICPPQAENFKKLEPKGSLYKYFGIDSVNTKSMLINFINKCKTGKYEMPTFVKKLSNTKDVSIFLD